LAQERQLQACRFQPLWPLLAPHGDMKKRKAAKDHKSVAENVDEAEESADEGAGAEVSPEELKAEAKRQSAMLDELLPERKQGASRGSGPARARDWDARRSTLLVSRFQPAPKASERSEGAGNSNRDDEEEEGEPKEKKKRKKKKVDPGESVDVNPIFARAFPGGPRRKEADLPEREDEAQEAAPEAPAEPDTGNVADWLTSIGTSVEPVAGQNAQSAPAAEIDWLSSIVSADAVVAGSKPSSSSTLNAYAGKPLPIAPFWRTAMVDELNAMLERQKSGLWGRMNRMKRDADRTQRKRGKVKLRTSDLRK